MALLSSSEMFRLVSDHKKGTENRSFGKNGDINYQSITGFVDPKTKFTNKSNSN